MKKLFFCTGKRTAAPTFTATPTLSAVAFVVGNTVTCNANYTGVVSSVIYSFYRGVTLLQTGASATYSLLQSDAGNTTGFYCKVDLVWSGGVVETNTAVNNVIYDANAYAFLSNSTLIANNTFATAENKWFIDTHSIFNKFSIKYPFIGASAANHKWNSVKPSGFISDYTAVFYGGLTHDSYGVKGNGTNGYIDIGYLNTLFNANDEFTATFYIKENMTSDKAIFGNLGSGFGGLSFSPKATDNNTYVIARSIKNCGNILSTTHGYVLLKRVENQVSIKVDDVLKYTYADVTAVVKPSGTLVLLARRYNGSTIELFSSRTIQGFELINGTTTDANDTQMFNAELARQTAYARQ